VKRIVVLGLMGQYPMGGMAWQVLHHVIGFQRLGYATFYVENSAAPPYSPRLQSVVDHAHENVAFLRSTFRRFDLAESWSYYDCLSRQWFGMQEARTRDILEHADLTLNLCGATLPDPDTARSREFLDAHDLHFTYGWNIGSKGCRIPTGGITWRKTHPPVVVDLWASSPHPRGSWRTVATYQNRGKDISLDGETYLWSKHPNFDRVMELPSCTAERLELALAVPDEAVRKRFLVHGWRLADPYAVSKTAAAYRRYLIEAKGEFSVEKDQYVRFCSGWFSDRTVCFLAAGRPCVVQDTGFGTRLPSKAGLLPWSTLEEAHDALERSSRDYQRHSLAAREVALEYFDTRVLLPPFLDAAGV
jgi:hypothetical protein